MSETEEKKVYIFIDNSNVFIEGKYSVGQHEKLGTIDKKRLTRYYELVRIEHGQLLEIVQNGRPLGANPFLLGSKPPSEDSVWKYIRKLGFDVTVYKRNAQDREKKVDVTLGCAMQKAIDKNPPGVLILIAGDGDYEWPISEAIENNWTVEVWFWKAATSNDLLKTDFHQLDLHYKHFTYGDGYSPNEKIYTLKLVSKMLEEWTNREAMQCFIRHDLFSRLKWESSTSLYLYFKEWNHVDMAKQWIKEHYDLDANEIL